MKYKVIKAVMSSLVDKNATARQVKLTLEPEELFATRVRIWSLIVDGPRVQQWESIINSGEFPVFNGADILVENLPSYRSKYDDRSCGPIMNSMMVFVRIDQVNQPCEDPRTVALKAIEKYQLAV